MLYQYLPSQKKGRLLQAWIFTTLYMYVPVVTSFVTKAGFLFVSLFPETAQFSILSPTVNKY